MRVERQQLFRKTLLVLFLLALAPLSATAAPVEVWHYDVVTTAPPSPGSGWGTVTQLLTGSGCNGTGCGSSWRPRNDSYTILLENAGDRVSKAHGSGDGSAPYNAAVVYRRQACPTDGAWASGMWHHNFQAKSQLQQTSSRIVQNGGQTHYFITLTQRWSSRYYQSFAHNDPCFSADPVTPTPTLPSGSPPTALPQPTVLPGQPTYTPLPTPTDAPIPTFPPSNPCTGGGSPIPEPSYSVWMPTGLTTSSPGPVFTSTVTLMFTQTPIGFGSDLKNWKEQFIRLEGPVGGRMIWAYDEGTDHGSTVRTLRTSNRRTLFTRPVPGSFRLLWGGHPNQPTIQFTTALTQLPPGAYRITSHTQNSACTPRFNEQSFYFQVGEPAPPPVPTVSIFGWARSPHDGATRPFFTTSNNPDPTRFAWTYGGIVEFYPDVALTLPTASGYRVTTTITGWHFRGSPPLDAIPVDRPLAYRQPIRILWSKYPPPELHASDVHTYRIARVDEPVAITVSINYTYQLYDATGLPIGTPLTGSIEGQFTVALVYTQVLDGGQP